MEGETTLEGLGTPRDSEQGSGHVPPVSANSRDRYQRSRGSAAGFIETIPANSVAATPAQVVERPAAVAPKTVRGRNRTPAVIRNHAKVAVDGPVFET